MIKPWLMGKGFISQADTDKLISIYNATQGENWTDNTNWLVDPIVENWYGITLLGSQIQDINLSTNNLNGVLPDLSGLSMIGLCYFYNNSISGDIANLPVGASYYDFYSTSVSGDVANLPIGADYYYFHSTSISGNIANLPTGASRYDFYNTSISGDVANLPTGASYYDFYSTSVSGDVANLPTDAIRYFFNNTSISGDVANLPIGALYYSFNSTSVSYTSGATTWTDGVYIYLQDNGWTEAQVDQFLADVDTSGATGGILHIGGTNAAPSAAGLTSKANLEGKGWTVTVSL